MSGQVKCADRKRRFRFSIRSMLLLVTLLSIGLAWLAHQHLAARAQQRVVVQLIQMMALPQFEDGLLPISGDAAESPGTGWNLQTLRGPRPVARVLNVSSDEALLQLPKLGEIEAVEVRGHVTEAGLAALGNLRSLEELSITRVQLPNAATTQFAGLRNLHQLSLAGSTMSDEGLRTIGQLHNLRALDLSGTGITDSALQSIFGGGRLKGLERLNLTETAVSDAGMHWISHLTKMKALDLDGTKVTNRGLQKLHRLTALDRVGIVETEIIVGGLAHLMMDVQQRELGPWFPGRVTPGGSRGPSVSLSGSQFGDDVMPYLVRGIPDLYSLSLSSTAITERGLAQLSGLNDFSKAEFDQTGIGRISSLPHLRELHLHGENPEMRGLPNLTSLTVRTLYTVSPSDAQFLTEKLAWLATEAPKLWSLQLEGPPIKDRHMAPLAELKQVRDLNLSRTNLTDDGIEPLREMANLHFLDVSYTQLTDAGIMEFAEFPNLRRLIIGPDRSPNSPRMYIVGGPGISAAAAAALQKAMPNCSVQLR